MKVFRFLAFTTLTVALIYLLDNRWVVGGKPIPPLGKFLAPYEGFWQNMESRDGYLADKPLDIPGLKDSVTIFYDSLMIPHVFAQNDEDLYLAQGYVTAMHRLWQMEFQTHAASGRVSEIIGAGDNEAILSFDRMQRRSGMVYGAQHALDAMQTDPISKMVVDQYTKGINAYIESLDYASLPFEYKLLAYKPESWTTLKCALLLKQMAQTLNMSDKDIEMTNALKLLGKQTLEILYPDMEPVGDPIVDNAGEWKFEPVKIDSFPLAIPEEYIKIDKMPGADPNNGSNNWAVSGSKTATGSPILCGDPHLDLSLPSIWYAIQLHAPGINVMGASLPGAPGVIIGFNDSIAWSVTNAQRDLVDWFKITYQDETRSKYLLDGKYVDTKKVVEEFKVRNQNVFYDTIVYTHWGPITYDENFRADRQNLNDYAFRWIAHDGSDEVVAFYKLNRGKSHNDYLDALNHFGLPAQNFVFASVSGDIAMRIQGKYPVRRQNEGRFVLDGSKSSNGWNAFIPNEQNVQYKNPARGFVSSANQYPVDATYPYYVTGKSFEAYRNRRINKLLTDYKNITVQDMMNMQLDNFNLKAAEALPIMLKSLDTLNLNAAEQVAWKALKDWNHYNDKASIGASYFEAWWNNFMPMLWDEMDKSDISLQRPTSFVTIKLLQEKPDFIFFDRQGTPEKENAQDIIRTSFSLGVKSIEKWKKDHPAMELKWGLYKDSFMRHLLRIEPLNIHVNAGGNSGIVNAHSRTNGPSWRMVVSLEKTGVKAWGVYPGGQSGNPGSKHYGDMIDYWTEGKHFSLRYLQQPDPKLQILKLNPTGK
ncbi:penicillin acylase family protein [Pseudochryseolinea flava]|uniref:Penicillin acylase family protein n=1 Tax=Pseudochryseolinea flava TaxID=2059302 RepID=A0A364Y671_9BACT|nr:penicillin acylase family protein [Pseudochryseolinea flava]RAW01317.1 penicillin acylase family protein [Pseudochryseolinea flava]